MSRTIAAPATVLTDHAEFLAQGFLQVVVKDAVHRWIEGQC